MKRIFLTGICILFLTSVVSHSYAQTPGMQKREKEKSQMQMMDQKQRMKDMMEMTSQMSEMMKKMSEMMKDMPPDKSMKRMSKVMKDMSDQMIEMSKTMEHGLINRLKPLPQVVER